MSGKQIFIWAVIVGLAIAGGVEGVLGLALWVAAFWLLEKAYDGVAAFAKGWRSAIADKQQKSPKEHKRPVLRVVK